MSTDHFLDVTKKVPAVAGRLDQPVRPVRCWYCGQQMHYSGHVAHEPEVRLTLDTGDTDEHLYLHTRCWNDWTQRRRGDEEYECGSAHGMRDALASTEGLGQAPEPTTEIARLMGVVGRVNARCDHLGMRLGEVKAERDKLRAFANDIMDCWPEGDVDGGYLQDMAEKHGLLKPEWRYEPCGAACTCAGTVEHAEWVDGVTCYRRTALLKGPELKS